MYMKIQKKNICQFLRFLVHINLNQHVISNYEHISWWVSDCTGVAKSTIDLNRQKTIDYFYFYYRLLFLTRPGLCLKDIPFHIIDLLHVWTYSIVEITIYPCPTAYLTCSKWQFMTMLTNLDFPKPRLSLN